LLAFLRERAKREAKKGDLTFPSLSLHISPFKPQISNFLSPSPAREGLMFGGGLASG